MRVVLDGLPVDVVAAEEVLKTVRARIGYRLTVLFALHIGCLPFRRDSTFTDALARGDLILPDGVSIQALAKLAKRGPVQKFPTTDFGWTVLAALREELARPVRVALIGGPPGLAARAGHALAEKAGAECVFTSPGIGVSFGSVFKAAEAACPDLVLVGLGMPLEAKVVDEYARVLRTAVVMTCGGWFGFLSGEEMRAPYLLQLLNLEWCVRLAQAPRRLAGRYFLGAFRMVAVAYRVLRPRRGRSLCS